MKTMLLYLRFFAFCFGILPVMLRADIPEWENSVQIFSNRSVESAISTGYGQNIGAARTSNAKHYLVGNDGVTIFSSPDFGDSQQGVTAVSSFGANVNVAYRYHVGANHDVIRLQRSSDGGENWLTTAFQFDPADSFFQ